MDATDRCDACGAQAYVIAVMNHGPVLYCGHHAEKWWVALNEQALKIDDQRWRLHVERHGDV